MEFNIVQENKNPFLMREELLLEIISDSAPKREEIVSSLKKGEGLVVVRKVHSNFGRNRFLVEVLVYDSVDSRNSVEVIPKKVRKKMEEERKAKAAEEKKKAEEAKKAAEEAKAAEEVGAKPEEVSEETKPEVSE